MVAKSDHITKQSIGLPFAVIETFFLRSSQLAQFHPAMALAFANKHVN